MGMSKKNKMLEFIVILLKAAHALLLATEASILNREDIQRRLVYISMIG